MWEGSELKPQSMNGWSYIAGNPINWIDPSGYQTECNIDGYCPEIDRYLCTVTPSGYDNRGFPCITNPNNVQVGNTPDPLKPSAASKWIPNNPTDRSWKNCQDDRDLTNWLYRELIDAVNQNADVKTLRKLYGTSSVVHKGLRRMGFIS